MDISLGGGIIQLITGMFTVQDGREKGLPVKQAACAEDLLAVQKLRSSHVATIVSGSGGSFSWGD